MIRGGNRKGDRVEVTLAVDEVPVVVVENGMSVRFGMKMSVVVVCS